MDKLVKRVSDNFYNKLIVNNNYDEIQLAKIKYGSDILFYGLFKIPLIIGIAIIFGMFKEFMIFAVFLSIIRKFAGGYHSKGYWECVILSCLLFIIIPNIILKIPLFSNIYFITINFIISLIIIGYFAPVQTKEKPIKSIKQQKQLKLQSIIVLIIMYITAFTLYKLYPTNSYYVLISSVWIIEAIIVTPLFYKIFKRPYIYGVRKE